jgi:hypothetical protein
VFGFSLKNALDLAGIRCAACAGADTLSTAGFTALCPWLAKPDDGV